MTYQLTVTADTLDELMAKVSPANAEPSVRSTDQMIEELKARLAEEDRTLVVRAQRNSKKKKDADAVEDKTDGDASDEADDSEEASTSETDTSETTETTEPDTVAPEVDFDTAMEAVKSAVLDTENQELAAKVRNTMGAFMAEHPHVTKLNEITQSGDQEDFCKLVEARLPELFADNEVGF